MDREEHVVSALGDGECCSSHWKSWQPSWAEGVQDMEKETFGSNLEVCLHQVDRLEQERRVFCSLHGADSLLQGLQTVPGDWNSMIYSEVYRDGA